jgi:hypothetical protein
MIFHVSSLVFFNPKFAVSVSWRLYSRNTGNGSRPNFEIQALTPLPVCHFNPKELTSPLSIPSFEVLGTE